MRSGTRIAVAAVAVAALAVPLAALAMTRGDQSGRRRAELHARRRADRLREVRRLPSGRWHRAVPASDSASDLDAARGAIAAVVQSGLMPPWPPGKRSPAYVGQSTRTLSAAQRATILAWVKAGAAD